jgi:hypothetical protein
MEVKDLKQIFICHLFEPKQKAYLTLFAESVDESFDVGRKVRVKTSTFRWYNSSDSRYHRLKLMSAIS